MNKKIVIFYTLLTLVIGGVIGFLITSKTQNTVSSTDTVQENLNDKKIVSGYSFEKTNKNIIWQIKEQKIRFGELQRRVEGCSKKVLTQQLELLIDNNIIINDKKTVNNIVESTYYLSNSGLALLPIMEKMIKWSNNNLLCGKEQ